jgi:hypothetical protein
MSTNTKPFWETNLNPITMFATSIPQPKRAKNNENIRRRYAKTEELEGYVLGKSLREELGIGARKIKELFATMGDEPKYNRGHSYYSTTNLQRVRDIVAESRPKIFDISNYISNQDLMKMFDFNKYKAWDIATKAKLVKTKFSRNIAYYERDKAIEAFTKYQK